MAEDNEIYDVLSLASSLNQDIHELNRNAIPGSKLGMEVINPKNIIGNLPVPPPSQQRPPQMNIEGLGVSGPTPLIPLEEVYPDGVPEHLKNTLMPPPVPPPVPAGMGQPMPQLLPPPVPSEPTPQMEFNFVEHLMASQPFQDYIDEKFLKLEIKVNKIYSLLKEILEKKQRKRRTSNKPVEQPKPVEQSELDEPKSE